MKEQPQQEEIRSWHEWFAVECNSAAWDLIGKSERTAAEDRQMLYVAHAAAFHSSMLGMPSKDARAELTLSRVFGVLGHGTDALRYAQRYLAYCDNNPCEDGDIAIGYIAMAHAAALLNDNETHAKYSQAAEEKIARIKTEGDRRLAEAELMRLPRL
jgi:hypothetical protein